MIGWSLDTDAQDTGTTRVTYDVWERLAQGSRIEVVTVPGDTERYYRHDIYVSPGNFAFDRVLLVGEIVGIVAGVLSLIIAIVQDRRSAAWMPIGEP